MSVQTTIFYFDNLIERAYKGQGDHIQFEAHPQAQQHVPFKQANAKCQSAFRTRSDLRAFSTDFAGQLLTF